MSGRSVTKRARSGFEGELAGAVLAASAARAERPVVLSAKPDHSPAVARSKHVGRDTHFSVKSGPMWRF